MKECAVKEFTLGRRLYLIKSRLGQTKAVQSSRKLTGFRWGDFLLRSRILRYKILLLLFYFSSSFFFLVLFCCCHFSDIDLYPKRE